jgi:copper oxidase (laccase) domain-containing protein
VKQITLPAVLRRLHAGRGVAADRIHLKLIRSMRAAHRRFADINVVLGVVVSRPRQPPN